MEELENLVCQTQEQLEVAQKIMADEKDRRSLSYQKIVDQTGIPKSTAERFLGLKSSNSSTVYFIVLCKLFGMSADSFFDITKESPTSSETNQAAHKIELLQLKNKYLIQIYYRKLIIFLEVLKCRQSLMFQGFPAFLVTEDVLKSP